MNIKIFDTLSKSKREFKPIRKGEVLFYHCGPTVYWRQHIGNMRAMVWGDLVRRVLLYSGYEVRYVRNYTDVGHLSDDADSGEDKMTKGAKREKSTPKKIADKYIKVFERDLKALNVLDTNLKPRATEYVRSMIEMVETLLEKGFAYERESAIYFDISKAKDYTRLSGQKLDANLDNAGHGDFVDEGKKNPQDFAVWVFKTGIHKNALQYWPSPFESPKVSNGEGFPGWHLECSAMAKEFLADTIDIHMGGIEHIPVHHTNEIAQSEAVNGVKYVNYWMHNEHLTVKSDKMSKSEGTSFTVEDIVAKGYNPIVLRYFFLQAHYRSKQNFTWESLEASRVAYQKILNRLSSIEEEPSKPKVFDTYKKKFLEFIQDDFNVSGGLSVLWEVLKDRELNDKSKLYVALDFDKVLGLNLEEEISVLKGSQEVFPTEVRRLMEERKKAREEKDWTKADKIRKVLAEEYSIEVKDS